jgi:hypothetical protein
MIVCFCCFTPTQPVCAQCLIREALQTIFRQAEEIERLRAQLPISAQTAQRQALGS